jgi:hypothetical protein
MVFHVYILFSESLDSNRYNLEADFVNNRHQIQYGRELYYVSNPSLISFLMVRVAHSKDAQNERSIGGKRT